MVLWLDLHHIQSDWIDPVRELATPPAQLHHPTHFFATAALAKPKCSVPAPREGDDWPNTWEYALSQ